MTDVQQVVAAIIEHHAQAHRQERWATFAAAAVLAHVRGVVVPPLAALEQEQARLAASRNCVGGLDALVREHSLRARAHARAKETVREVLEPGYPEPQPDLEAAALAAIEHLRLLAAHVPGTGRTAMELQRWVNALERQ